MSDDDTNTTGGEPGLVAELDRMTRRAGTVELRVRLTSTHPDRTLHYIAEPRAIVFDAARDVFVVRLSDEGREVIPGAASMLPAMARVDPGESALLTLRLPDEIVRLRPAAAPTAEVELERLTIGPDATIEVVVGWSDTAFYPDPRAREDDPGNVTSWERAQTRLTVEPRRRRRRGS
jgi:hypothetical protein